MTYSTHVNSFCKEFNYPAEACCFLTESMKKIEGNEESFSIFDEQVMLYESGSTFSHPEALKAAIKTAEIAGVHSYTAQLLIYICFAKHTRVLYAKQGISDEIYIMSMSDLKWKLMECYNVYSIWGTFVAFWFDRFFDLTRFALGRLQFETVPFQNDYTNGNNTVKAGDTVINIHIPSCGPLQKEDCQKSYYMASEFYKKHFIGKKTIFQCNSWLLYPKHIEFLPRNSNILSFMDDFDIYSYNDDPDNSNAWRIFGSADAKKPLELPQKTSIQKAYAAWFAKGGTMGIGKGIFFK